MFSHEDLPQPRCISKSGECPVKGCAEDGECYLWRCENPHAPKPEREDESDR